jgi:hypothetical protein
VQGLASICSGDSNPGVARAVSPMRWRLSENSKFPGEPGVCGDALRHARSHAPETMVNLQLKPNPGARLGTGKSAERPRPHIRRASFRTPYGGRGLG